VKGTDYRFFLIKKRTIWSQNNLTLFICDWPDRILLRDMTKKPEGIATNCETNVSFLVQLAYKRKTSFYILRYWPFC